LCQFETKSIFRTFRTFPTSDSFIFRTFGLFGLSDFFPTLVNHIKPLCRDTQVRNECWLQRIASSSVLTVYMEQFQVFGKPDRDPVERTLSIAYFALIDIHQYEKQLSDEYHAEWFLLSEMPELIFDHTEMVRLAQRELRYKAALHPILFQLLPEKFTIPQLQALYEGVYNTTFDDRNFSRKLLSTGLLVKLHEKDKLSSKKGAFYYKLDQSHYEENFDKFLNLVPNPDKFF